MLHTLNQAWLKCFLNQVIVNPNKTFLFVAKDKEEEKKVNEIISTFFSNQKNISFKDFGYYCVTTEQQVKQDMIFFKDNYPIWNDILISHDIYDLKIKDFLHKHIEKQNINMGLKIWLEGCRRYKELKEKEKMSKRYKFYSDGANKIVAVSSYAGRTVRGIAKCDPRDNFNRSKGEELAQARCNLKVASKRFNRAISEVEKAKQAVITAQHRVEKMESYLTDAHNQLAQADRDLKRIESEL